MSRGVNSCTFIGNAGKDAETKFLPSGGAVTNFSIAVGKKWKDKNGQEQEHTEWVRVVVFSRLAEICGEYVKKGIQLYVCGEMKTNKWQDKDGIERYTTEIIANEVQFLGNRGAVEANTPPVTQVDSSDDFNQDVPF